MIPHRPLFHMRQAPVTPDPRRIQERHQLRHIRIRRTFLTETITQQEFQEGHLRLQRGAHHGQEVHHGPDTSEDWGARIPRPTESVPVHRILLNQAVRPLLAMEVPSAQDISGIHHVHHLERVVRVLLHRRKEDLRIRIPADQELEHHLE